MFACCEGSPGRILGIAVKVGCALPEGLLPLPSAGDALNVRFDQLADGLSGTQDLIERSGIH